MKSRGRGRVGGSKGHWIQCLLRSFSEAGDQADSPTDPYSRQGLPLHHPSPMSPVSWLLTQSLSAPAVRQLERKLTFPHLCLLWGLGEESPSHCLCGQARLGGCWLGNRSGPGSPSPRSLGRWSLEFALTQRLIRLGMLLPAHVYYKQNRSMGQELRTALWPFKTLPLGTQSLRQWVGGREEMSGN